MRKRISLLLVLAMVLMSLAGFVSAEEEIVSAPVDEVYPLEETADALEIAAEDIPGEAPESEDAGEAASEEGEPGEEAGEAPFVSGYGRVTAEAACVYAEAAEGDAIAVIGRDDVVLVVERDEAWMKAA